PNSSGMSRTKTGVFSTCSPNWSRSLSRCSSSITKIASAHARSRELMRRLAEAESPAERARSPGRRPKSFSAVGLRHRFREHTKRRRGEGEITKVDLEETSDAAGSRATTSASQGRKPRAADASQPAQETRHRRTRPRVAQPCYSDSTHPPGGSVV